MGGPTGQSVQARQEAAASWFTRLSQPKVTTDALRAFREWRQDPDNRRAYEDIEGVWKSAGPLANDPDILALRSQVRTQVAERPRKRARRRTLGLAGGALLAMALAIGVGYSLRPLAYESGVGEQRVIRLTDGSVLRLNTDSRAVVQFSDGERVVRLDRGEALFEVAHDPARPFLVRADGTTVRAIGTVFDVRRNGERIDVTLVKGVVQVSAASGPPHTLRPNQKLEVLRGTVQPPRDADATGVTSWTERRLTFEATPLGAAVADVNRYADQKVTLAAAELATAPVSGVFETGDAKGFTAAVAHVFDLQVTEDRDGDLSLGRPAAASEK